MGGFMSHHNPKSVGAVGNRLSILAMVYLGNGFQQMKGCPLNGSLIMNRHCLSPSADRAATDVGCAGSLLAGDHLDELGKFLTLTLNQSLTPADDPYSLPLKGDRPSLLYTSRAKESDR